MSIIDHIETLLVNLLLPAEAQHQFQSGRIGREQLVPFEEPIRRLSNGYLQSRAPSRDLAILPLSELDATAYALYFTPINAAKVAHLLEQIPSQFFQRPLRVLDIGCGPGTALLSLMNFLRPSDPHELLGCDHSAAMLSLCRTLVPYHYRHFERAAISFTLTPSVDTIEGTFDLIIAANVFNEMSQDRQLATATTLCKRLTEGGALVILEPAIPEITRTAMMIRDHLLAGNERLVPLFPCTRRDRCPMLAREPDNWCHNTLRWEEPALTRQLDELTGFNKHRIKYCGFVFQLGGKLLDGYRVVEEPERSKRGTTASVCGPQHYGEITGTKKDAELHRITIRRSRQYDLLGSELVESAIRRAS